MRFYTVGHGNRTTEELVATLRAAGVERLVDVRRFPGSRRHPHMGEAALRRSLPDLGVVYDWRGDVLGGRRTPRPLDETRHPAWREAPFRGYADFTDTDEYRRAIEDLEGTPGPLAVMCAETVWWRCHRRLLADSLVVRGHEVVHLLAPGRTQQHRLPPSARVGEDGWPVYDVGADVPML